MGPNQTVELTDLAVRCQTPCVGSPYGRFQVIRPAVEHVVTAQPLTNQFAEAQSRVNLGRRRLVAQAAHLEVRAVLKLSPELQSHGLHDVLIGSYARDTGIWPGKDVDIFGKLTKDSVETITPGAAYNLFLATLSKRFDGRLVPQPRSIKIEFGPSEDRRPRAEFLQQMSATAVDVFPFSVDVVPAVANGTIWAIPSGDRDDWTRSAPAKRWIDTDPEQLSNLTTQQNDGLKIGSQGAYVPTVKAIRQIRRHHLGDAKPGGFYLELCTYEAFAEQQANGTSWAEITATTLSSVARRLSRAVSDPLCDPVLERPYLPAPDPAALSHAAGVFAQLAQRANAALSMDLCQGSANWRWIFGSNGKGPVFPLPSNCNEDGTLVVPAPVRSPLRGSNEARGFGA